MENRPKGSKSCVESKTVFPFLHLSCADPVLGHSLPPHPYHASGMPNLDGSLLPPLTTDGLAVCMLLLRL